MGMPPPPPGREQGSACGGQHGRYLSCKNHKHWFILLSEMHQELVAQLGHLASSLEDLVQAIPFMERTIMEKPLEEPFLKALRKEERIKKGLEAMINYKGCVLKRKSNKSSVTLSAPKISRSSGKARSKGRAPDKWSI